MRSASSRVWLRFVSLSVLACVVLLGEMRPAASETGQRAPAAKPSPTSVDRTGVLGAADPQADAAVDASDAGRLVPAIYAWDPDVRFIYYRHISKWM